MANLLEADQQHGNKIHMQSRPALTSSHNQLGTLLHFNNKIAS